VSRAARTVALAAGMLALVFSVLSACATSGAGAGSSGSNGDETDSERTLTVLAAASLTESFTALGHRFEQQHPGVQVRFSFDSSATLAEQAVQGAPADVLATADRRTMQRAVTGGAVSGHPSVFATNTPVVVGPADNPAGIAAVSDLDHPSTSYVVCVATAPCGAIADQVLADQDIDTPPRSREVDVKAVLTKVQLGEADAGLVYATDAHAAGDRVTAVPVPHAERYLTSYPAAVLATSAHPALARQWLDLLASPAGRGVLTDAGFSTP